MSMRSQAEADAAQISELSEDNTDLRRSQSQMQYSLPLIWVAGATAVCLIGGFLRGLMWLDKRSRARHGGIRIY